MPNVSLQSRHRQATFLLVVTWHVVESPRSEDAGGAFGFMNTLGMAQSEPKGPGQRVEGRSVPWRPSTTWSDPT